MLDDDYGPICRRRDVWAFTEYTKPRYSSRKDTTTDADINRLMKATFPDRKFVSSLSAEVRAAARARLLNEGPI